MTEFQVGDRVRYTDIPMHGGYRGRVATVRQVIVDKDGKEFLNLGSGHGGTKVGTYDWIHDGARRFELVSRAAPVEDFESVEDADRWLSQHEPSGSADEPGD